VRHTEPHGGEHVAHLGDDRVHEHDRAKDALGVVACKGPPHGLGPVSDVEPGDHRDLAGLRCPLYVRPMSDRIATRKRSIVKALTYRVFIICLDFTAVYLLTGQTKAALGFMIISNIYTTVGYVAHERVWERIKWGFTPGTADAGA
jgi:adenylylsulfate kinase